MHPSLIFFSFPSFFIATNRHANKDCLDRIILVSHLDVVMCDTPPNYKAKSCVV